MRVLIVEDAAFNAFCLCRVLELAIPFLFVTVVPNSVRALAWLKENTPDLVIVDGDLGATDGQYCNGPALAHEMLNSNNTLSLIAWTDSKVMCEAFATVFSQHGRFMNQCNSWPKLVSEERVRETVSYYFGDTARLSRLRA